VTRLCSAVAEFCERARDQSLRALMHRLDLVLLSGYDEEVPVPEGAVAADAVQVMTIHQAKGLEFDTVFLPAMVEGRLPQPHRGEGLELPPAVLEASIRGREDHVAEERRLAYVAMTRARQRLFLSWAERYEGTRAWRRSRFLGELMDSGRVEERRVKGAGAGDTGDRPVAPEPPEGAGPTLSFSAIAAYRECPRQHWFRYVVRLPAVQSVEAQYGSAMHEVLMRAGAMRQRGEEVRLADLELMLDGAWARTSFADARRAPALRALAGRQLAAFHAAGGVADRPEMVERSFTTDLDNWRLRGIIDRVDRLPPPTLEGGEAGSSYEGKSTVGRRRSGLPEAGGGWRLVDYKTGSALPASRLRRDLQLALYALGAREGLGLDGPLELEIVYLKDGKHVVIPATGALLDEARRVGAEVAAAIADGRFEPRPERRRCSLCAYRLACDAAR
jgi:ATP-dependent DNA helicase UvrD/PcrA